MTRARGALAAALAAVPLALMAGDLRPTGSGMNVEYAAGGYSFEFRPELNEVVSGRWQKIPLGQPDVARGASDLRLSAACPAPGGGEIGVAVSLRQSGRNVIDTEMSWSGAPDFPGFGRLDIWLPEAEAGDLVVELDGKPGFENWNRKLSVLKEVRSVAARRASTGKTLFEASPKDGVFPRIELFFEPDRPDRGLFIRFFNVENPNASGINDATKVQYRVTAQ